MNNWVESLEPRRHLDAGNLDPSFGNNGFIERTVTGYHLNDADVAVSRAGDMVLSAVAVPDPDVVTVVAAPPLICIWRIHADGTPMSTWGGGDGQVTLEFPNDVESATLAQTSSWVMSDGGVLIQVGQRFWKLRTDGSLDKGFGHNGRANFTDFRSDRARVDVDTHGRIYFAGGLNDTYKLQLLRLNPDCSLDTSFGGDGIVEPAAIPNTLAGHRVRALDDGKVLLSGAVSTGATTHDYVALRLDESGDLDPTYGTGGVSTGQFGGGPDDDGIVESVNPLTPTSDGYAPFFFSVEQQEMPVQVFEERIGAYDPNGTFIETWVNDPQFGSYTRNDALFLGVSTGAIGYLDADGDRIDAASAAADEAVAIPGEATPRIGNVALASDGTIVITNNSSGDGPNQIGNAVRLYRLFRDDAPVGQLLAKNLTQRREASYQFTIQYRDDDGIDLSTLGDDDITVALPGGGRRAARRVATDVTTGSPKIVTATYKITSPDGVWDFSDNGYTVRVERRSVRDINGNAAAQRPIGAFRVAIPPDVVGTDPVTPFTPDPPLRLADLVAAPASWPRI